MKTFFARLVILILVMAAVGASALSASAAGTASVSLSAPASAEAGSEFSVTVNVNGAAAIKGIAVTAVYDAMQFTLVKGEFLVSGVLQDFSIDTKDGVIAFASPTDINGGVLKLTFRMADNAVREGLPITCEVVLSTDEGNTEHSATAKVAASCKHSFTKKITEDKYLCSKATCTQKAKYYYACQHCLEKGTQTFESGEKTAHTFDQKNTADKYAKVKETCSQKGTYYFSCKCGEKGTQTFDTTDTPSHKYENVLKADENSHWTECSRCGDKKDASSHSWDEGEITKEPTSEEDGEKTFTCEECGYKRTDSVNKLPSDTSDTPEESEFPEASDAPEESELPEESNTPEESQKDESLKADVSAGTSPDGKRGAPWVVVITLAIVAAAGWIFAALLWFKSRK